MERLNNEQISLLLKQTFFVQMNYPRYDDVPYDENGYLPVKIETAGYIIKAHNVKLDEIAHLARAGYSFFIPNYQGNKKIGFFQVTHLGYNTWVKFIPEPYEY